MLWVRALLGIDLSQSQCRVGWSPRISRTPLGFQRSAPFALSDTTSSGAQAWTERMLWGSALSGSPIAEPVPRRLVSSNFENASGIRAFGSDRIVGHDAGD